MTASLKQPALNPYAPPVLSAPPAETDPVSGSRASLQTLREVNFLYVVAEVSYVAVCVSFFWTSCVALSAVAQLGWIAYWGTSFVFWCTTMASLFKSRGITLKTILTVLLLPVPLLGTIVFLSAKQEIRLFMITNGFLQAFVGFQEDAEERNAMAENLDYIPSLYFQQNGSRRKRGFTVSACMIMTVVVIGVLILIFA